MKRFFFTVIALSAVAVGCTKSGLLESPQTYEAPISFEPYTGKAPVTKATVVETDDIEIDGFRVIGFEEGTEGSITPASTYLRKVVKYGKATTDATTDTWFYNGKMFWPEGKKLSFVAYGLNVNGTTTTIDNDTASDTYGDVSNDTQGNFVRGTDYTSFTYNVPPQVANQKDLVISPMMTGKNSSSGTIEVELYHVLSRIGFQLTTSGSKDINVIIKNISLKGVKKTTASFDLADAVSFETSDNTTTVKYTNTSSEGTAVDYSLFDSNYAFGGTNAESSYPAFITASAATASTVKIFKNTTFAPTTGDEPYDPADHTMTGLGTDETSRYMMILPQTLDATVEVIYQLEGAQEQVASLPVKRIIEAGKAYEFVFTVSTNAVGFNVEVGLWNPTIENDGVTETDPIDKEYPLTPAE